MTGDDATDGSDGGRDGHAEPYRDVRSDDRDDGAVTDADIENGGHEGSGREGDAPWHARPVSAAFDALDTGPSGLAPAEAERRLEEYGPNRIDEGESVSPLALLASQFQDVLIYLLVAAALLSLGVGALPGEEPNYVDAGLILLILLANGLFGFVQDYRAERSMQALRELSTPDATVVRDGESVVVDASAVVPGDVVIVEQGDAVPADARLIEASSLETNESALTGESTSVAKSVDPVEADAPLAERSDMVYTSTTVVRGRGRAVVVATGMGTAVGGIASQLREAEDVETPFQAEVDELGRRIGLGVVALILVVAAVQFLFTAAAPLTILLAGVTLAVAAVPEGLPAIVTLTLALGSRRLLRRNALVRRLPVVESLGSVDVIVTDKTGTLTESRMTVTRLYAGGDVYERADGEADEAPDDGPERAFRREATDDGDVEVDGTGGVDGGERAGAAAALDPLLRCGAVCNNAEPATDDRSRGKRPDGVAGRSGGDGEPNGTGDTAGRTRPATNYRGDPTEVALLLAAESAGIDRPDPGDRLREVPFSSERKRMTVVVEEDSTAVDGGAAIGSTAESESTAESGSTADTGDGATVAYMKGAPEVVLDRCDRVLVDGEVVPLTDDRREAVLETVDGFAADALRVLGFARKALDDVDVRDVPEDELEGGMVFLGLQGMVDPPRPEVEAAVADCRAAGIRVVMATGDTLATARAIGDSLGFDATDAMTGREVEALADDDLRAAVEDVDVFARVAPEHKVRILRALQAEGHRVAMTGDGVNDAPALRSADVGVSMGLRGTDVATEASDMVLQDDDFATIRDAVAEGRAIFDNIRKFVNLLLSANAGEVLLVFLGVLLGTVLFPDRFAADAEALVLTPVMLLWINLVTDGLPALALGIDPKAGNVMQRPPRPPDEPVIDRRAVASVLTLGSALTVTGLALFFRSLASSGSLLRAQTLLFTFVVVAEMGAIQLIRRRFGHAVLSNRWLVGAVAGSLGLQLVLLYTPLRRAFDLVALGAGDWAWIAAGFVAFLALNLVLDRLYRAVFGRERPGGADADGRGATRE